MRCDECGRPIQSAEMWQLAGTRNAPPARTMQILCRDCRVSAGSRPIETVVQSPDDEGEMTGQSA
ncbi:MAG TPA: hypothetical protein VIC85_17095 [Ktedonobacterales bacterium]